MPRLPQTRLGRFLLPAFAAAATFAGAGLAYFTATGSGSATGSVGTLTPATISAPTSSGASAALSWTSQATLGNASLNGEITYTVQRRSGSGSYTAVASGPCAGTLPYATSSCTDTLGASGTYTYRVIAVFGSWTADSNETIVDATLPVAASTTVTSSNNPSSAASR